MHFRHCQQELRHWEDDFMNTTKIIKGVVSNGRYTVTAPIVKEDYGLYLKIEGVELPSTYEVDFSNSESSGTSVTMIGNADGVLIPRQFIDTGKDIFAFLYHVGEDFGRTVYKFRIPNKVRPDRTDETPTPEEQSVIDQLIGAMNTAVAQTRLRMQVLTQKEQKKQGQTLRTLRHRQNRQGMMLRLMPTMQAHRQRQVHNPQVRLLRVRAKQRRQNRMHRDMPMKQKAMLHRQATMLMTHRVMQTRLMDMLRMQATLLIQLRQKQVKHRAMLRLHLRRHQRQADMLVRQAHRLLKHSQAHYPQVVMRHRQRAQRPHHRPHRDLLRVREIVLLAHRNPLKMHEMKRRTSLTVSAEKSSRLTRIPQTSQALKRIYSSPTQ